MYMFNKMFIQHSILKIYFININIKKYLYIYLKLLLTFSFDMYVHKGIKM